jgi:hypothetical protein
MTNQIFGVPVTSSKLHVVNWHPVDEKLIKRLDGWKRSALSFGGRLIHINSCLSSIPIYYAPTAQNDSEVDG